ncbi:phasin family protein [Lutimaribacter marinistellae]|uniref:Phasin family protein n=1 Tax=Lutimaribacter marinistellae TaxID=1820329 RepID=A0ABV7TLP4_9RHOB
MTKDDKTADPTKAMTDMMAQMQKMGTDAMAAMGGDWAERMSKVGTEVMSFAADRMKQDMEFQQKLLQCRDMQELQQVQSRFWQEAIEQYRGEMERLAEMGGGMWSMPGQKPGSKD